VLDFVTACHISMDIPTNVLVVISHIIQAAYFAIINFVFKPNQDIIWYLILKIDNNNFF